MKFNLLLTTLFLFSCTKSNQIPEPQFRLYNPVADISSCQIHDFTINFEYESYSIDGGEPHPWNSKLSGWIPDETSPVFYIITYDWRFCNFLELDLETYSFTVEDIGNPDGYWYEVTTSEAEFANVLAGLSVHGRLKRYQRPGFKPNGSVFD
jgi:hypothetical protein